MFEVAVDAGVVVRIGVELSQDGRLVLVGEHGEVRATQADVEFECVALPAEERGDEFHADGCPGPVVKEPLARVWLGLWVRHTSWLDGRPLALVWLGLWLQPPSWLDGRPLARVYYVLFVFTAFPAG